MQRRHLLQKFFAVTAAAPLLLASEYAQSAPIQRSPFDSARWAPLNSTRLHSVIEQFGSSSKNYDAKRRPYAVFDWDNTCIMNDCEEALLMHLINQLGFKFNPDEFSDVIRKDVPAGHFKVEAGYATVDKKPVNMSDLADDIAENYRKLFAQKQSGKNPDEIRESEEFKDFRAKLYFMYEAICDSYPIEIGYKWIIYLFANLTPAELQAMAELSNNRALGDGLRKVNYESSRQLPGKAGVVATEH
ncbi:MAG: haloacid dehalogenase-like hydrolase, partial [Pseudomonadota bacterium]